MNKPLKVLLLAVLPLSVLACGIQGRSGPAALLSSAPPMIEPGDKINTMLITTGAKDATPLWPFCLPTIETDQMIVVNCDEVSFSRLAIGHTFGVMDRALGETDWSELTWELYLDGKPINLNSFDTYSFEQPGLVHHPASIQVAFQSVQAWDVVLENPTPGAHVVSGNARFGDKTYTWIVNFSVIRIYMEPNIFVV